MGLTARLDGFQRRHDWLGFPIAVAYKFFEDQGNFLAALITYYGFISLFFLLLLFVAIVSFLAQGHPGLRSQIVHSAITDFPIVGNRILTNIRSLATNRFGLVAGVVVSLHGGLEVVQAGQKAFNRVWAVPRQDRLNPAQTRIRSAAMLGVLGVGVLVTTGLSGFTTNASPVIGEGATVAATLVSFVLNVAIFVVAYRWLTSLPLRTRDVAPGAVMAGIAWQVLQLVGTFYVARTLRGTAALAGLFGVVLGLLAWIYVEAVVTVVCAEVNVVLARRLWPRGLLSLFTDTKNLTPADQAVYAFYAGIERYKSFQHISVTFDPARPLPPEQPPPAELPHQVRLVPGTSGSGQGPGPSSDPGAGGEGGGPGGPVGPTGEGRGQGGQAPGQGRDGPEGSPPRCVGVGQAVGGAEGGGQEVGGDQPQRRPGDPLSGGPQAAPGPAQGGP